jgi:GNAT superfamily N-acetyltransferase
VPASALRNPGVVITAHAGLAGYRGVWFFVRGESAIVSAPAPWVSRLERTLAASEARDLLAPGSAERALGAAAGEIVGPSFQGWLDPACFAPVAAQGVRGLAAESAAEALRALRSSGSPTEWDHGGIDGAVGEIWSALDRDAPVALGRLRPHEAGAVDPCVFTHPAHRGRGHALRIVSAMAQQALSEERLVLYQTLLSNRPAVAIALRLGFQPYATLLAVRLAV